MLTKEIVRDQIEKMPEQFSVDQLFERLIFIEKVEKGIQDSKNKRTFSHKEMGFEIEKWKFK